MMVPRHVLNLNEIATWFDRLTMSGCAPRNDNRMTLGFSLGSVDILKFHFVIPAKAGIQCSK